MDVRFSNGFASLKLGPGLNAEALQGIAILGPTASGKSSLAMTLAKAINGEIIACDSVQVYKHLNIGSAKPSAQDQATIPHHMIDLFDLNQPCDAATYASLAAKALQDIRARNKIPIIVVGTGLYFRALCDDQFADHLPNDPKLREQLHEKTNHELIAQLRNLDPERARQIHLNDHFRLARALEIVLLSGKTYREAIQTDTATARANSPQFFKILLSPPRAYLHQRIASRTDQMLEQGLLEEVAKLLTDPANLDCKPLRSIGYLQCLQNLQGDLPSSELRDRIVFATRQYAKRQSTWFKKVSGDFTAKDFPLDESELAHTIQNLWSDKCQQS